MSNFFTELRRRKIWWVAGVYIAASWIIMQVVGFVEEPLRLPDWADTLAIVLLMAGLPVAIILAWAQESQAAGDQTASADADEPASRKANPPSIAVLPFENMSDDKDQEYLADGMTEELINSLVQFQGWRVTARNSSFAYKGKSPDIREVGRDLGVRYVVEGSIRKVGENIRVTAQLVRTDDGTHVWSNTYDRPLNEIFMLQDEVVAAISRTLTGRLLNEEEQRATRAAPENLDAWALLIRSRSMLPIDRETRDEQLSLVQESLKIDPDYPAANAVMAFILARNINFGITRTTEDKITEARRYAERALRHGMTDVFQLGLVSNALGMLGDNRRALTLAESAYRITGRMTGNYATALGRAGRIDDAIVYFRQLMDEGGHDNEAPLFLSRGLALLLAIKGEYEEALEYTLIAQDQGPGSWLILGDLANLYGHLGQTEKALDAWAEVNKLVPGSTVRTWQNAWRQQYGTDEAVEALTGGYRKAGIED